MHRRERLAALITGFPIDRGLGAEGRSSVAEINSARAKARVSRGQGLPRPIGLSESEAEHSASHSSAPSYLLNLQHILMFPFSFPFSFLSFPFLSFFVTVGDRIYIYSEVRFRQSAT